MFGFKASNKVVEYKAFLTGLRLAREIQIERLLINSDFQLVVSKVNGNFSAKDKSMATYIKLVMEFILTFESFELT